MPKQETRNTCYWIILDVSTVSGNEMWLVGVILQKTNFLSKNSRLFLIFKESSVKRNLTRSASWFGQKKNIWLYDINWWNFMNRLFTSQVIPLNVFLFPGLGMKSKVLNFDFLENERSFWSEIKNIFPIFTSALF